MRWTVIEANLCSTPDDKSTTKAMLIPGGVIIKTERQMRSHSGIALGESMTFVPGEFRFERDRESPSHLGVHNLVPADSTIGESKE